MKKYFTLLVLVYALSGCKKEENTTQVPPNSNEKKYSVNFSAGLFDQSAGIFKSAVHTSGDPMPKLYTRIYDLDANGILISKSTTNNLPKGNYVAVFVASNHEFSRLYSFDGPFEPTKFSTANFDTMLSVAAKSFSLDDIFFKKVFFTVSNQDINQTVVLERIVAGLEVIIEDEVPPAVTKLELTVADDAVNFYFDKETRTTGACDKISSFGRTKNPLTAFVLGLGGKAIIVRAYDKDGKVIEEKRLGATFYANKKTTLSGKLFTDLAVFSVTVNPVWDTPPPTIPF